MSQFLDDLKCHSRENFRNNSKHSMIGILGKVYLKKKRKKFIEIRDLLKTIIKKLFFFKLFSLQFSWCSPFLAAAMICFKHSKNCILFQVCCWYSCELIGMTNRRDFRNVCTAHSGLTSRCYQKQMTGLTKLCKGLGIWNCSLWQKLKFQTLGSCITVFCSPSALLLV